MRKCILILLLSTSLKLYAQTDTTVLNRTNLLHYMSSINLKYIDIVYAQVLIESGSLKSHLARHNHNLFGMHIMYNRRNTAIGKSKSGYAIYRNWRESVDDYALFQNRLLMRVKSRREYINYISHNYSQNKNYRSIIMNTVKNTKNLKLES